MATQIPGYASLVMLQISDHESFSLYCQYRNIGEWSRTQARRLFIRPDWKAPGELILSWPPRVLAGLGWPVGI